MLSAEAKQPLAPLKLATEIKWADNQEAVTFLG
jgi:hypothetical protein